MGELTKNLSRHEFACKCDDDGGYEAVDMELAIVVQEGCDYFKTSVTINSGNRCPKYNEEIGGHPNSYHKKSMAADVMYKGVDPKLVAAYFRREYPGRYGIGEYNSFTHIDVQHGCKRWTGA
jgi:uncharacterized protein YcbK (DUF882 family)